VVAAETIQYITTKRKRKKQPRNSVRWKKKELEQKRKRV
jgi:hypothetical protein